MRYKFAEQYIWFTKETDNLWICNIVNFSFGLLMTKINIKNFGDGKVI